MTAFGIKKQSDSPLCYQVIGIEPFDGEISVEKGVWCLRYHDETAGLVERRFESLLLGLAAVGLINQCQFKGDSRVANISVNTLIDNLRPYVDKVSEDIPGTNKKKLVRDIRADLEEVNAKLSLCLKRDEGGVERLSCRIRDDETREEKNCFISTQQLLTMTSDALLQKAVTSFDTTKPLLGILKPMPLVQEKLAFALNQTKGQSSKCRDLFYDVVMMGFLEKPIYCPSIKDRIAIYDASSIQELLRINQNYRDVLQAIDKDTTNIRVILDNPNDDELSDIEKGFNPLFKACIDSQTIALQADSVAVEEEPEEREADDDMRNFELLVQLALYLHFPPQIAIASWMATHPASQERQAHVSLLQRDETETLEEIFHQLSHAVIDGLPSQIKELIKKRQEGSGDLEELEALLLSLTNTAVIEVKNHLLVMFKNIDSKSSNVLSVLEKDGSLDNLIKTCLAIKYQLNEAPYFNVRLADEHCLMPIFLQYREMLFHKQAALREDYRGRLQAQYNESGDELTGEAVRQYHDYEYRDPVDRRTIDTRDNLDARTFQQIIIGGLYLAHAGNTLEIDETVRAFVEEELTKNEDYLNNAKEAYINYMLGLSDYGLPERLKLHLKDAFGIDPSLYGHVEVRASSNLLAFLNSLRPGSDAQDGVQHVSAMNETGAVDPAKTEPDKNCCIM